MYITQFYVFWLIFQVVDIMHGLEPQTLESINLLKTKKTPFIVALNKIDRLYDWSTMARKDVRDVLKAQAPNTQLEFEQRTKEIIVQFAEQVCFVYFVESVQILFKKTIIYI